MFSRLLRRRPGRQLIDRLHGDIVTAARRTEFYVICGVPDTFEGRFELLVLHASAVVRRLNALPDPGPAMAQELTDSMFEHLDIALREIGVSDLGVPKRMKKLASAYFGRTQAYAAALAAEGDEPLEAALARNLYGGSLGAEDARVRAVGQYFRALEVEFARRSPSELLSGSLEFPPAPDAE